MPIGLHAIYLINFREDITLYREFDDFLHCISSILTSYEWAHQAKSGKKVDPWYKAEAQSLSPREKKILELIRSGMTNAEIADEIGYSESLIRQETVAIYRKLGVSGRKEIKDEDSTPKRATRSVIRVAITLSGIEVLLPILEIFNSSSALSF
jgi:DNA-binding CsgD family transcriptional regulator